MLPTKRAYALAVAIALAVPLAAAQSAPLRVELSPDSVTTTIGVAANSTVRVYNNNGLTPLAVTLVATNATGGLVVDFDADELSVLPGGSSSSGLHAHGNKTGTWQVTIRADGRNAISGAYVGSAYATLTVTVNAPASGNGTGNSTGSGSGGNAGGNGNATSPPATQPSTSPGSSNGGGPTIQPVNETPPATKPTPPPPRVLVAELTLEAGRGDEATFRIPVQNPADVAQRVEITLELPLGWAGQLDALRLDIPAGGTAEARGLVSPGSQARDDTGALRIRAAGGDATVRLAFRVVEPAPAPTAREPDTSNDAVLDGPTEIARTPLIAAQPATPALRVVPDEVGARPGASVVFTLYVANPGDVALVGHARANAAPLLLRMDEPAFTADARDEALVTFIVTIPDDVGEGTTYEGLASTSLAEAAVPFRVKIESAEAAPVTSVATVDDAGIGPLVLGAAGLGVAAIGIGVAWRRWPMLGLLPLYARLAPGRALEHPRRQAIVALLRAEPGLTLAEVRRRIGMSNGVARHHLQLLEAAGVVRAVPDGALRRLWPVGEIVKPVPPLRERAIETLREKGHMRASDLADTLGVSRQALHYHVKRLLDEGRIVARREANEVTLALQG